MQDNSCSALVVTKHDGLHAVVTERDIIRALANGSDPDDDWAVDVMSTDLRTLSPDAPILDAAKLMLDAVVRHVVIEEGEQLSVVSVRDLLAPFIASVEA
jgi:CBS domain-containing protein